jgi:hypothetical protein
LVLNIFAEMPEYNLTVCGPIQKEKDFEKVYYNPGSGLKKENHIISNSCRQSFCDYTFCQAFIFIDLRRHGGPYNNASKS